MNLIESIKRLFKPEKKKDVVTWAPAHTIDFTKGKTCWGHNYSILQNRDNCHLTVVFWYNGNVVGGDCMILSMKSGKDLAFKITYLRRYADPLDMYFCELVPQFYIDEKPK